MVPWSRRGEANAQEFLDVYKPQNPKIEAFFWSFFEAWVGQAPSEPPPKRMKPAIKTDSAQSPAMTEAGPAATAVDSFASPSSAALKSEPKRSRAQRVIKRAAAHVA